MLLRVFGPVSAVTRRPFLSAAQPQLRLSAPAAWAYAQSDDNEVFGIRPFNPLMPAVFVVRIHPYCQTDCEAYLAMVRVLTSPFCIALPQFVHAWRRYAALTDDVVTKRNGMASGKLQSCPTTGREPWKAKKMFAHFYQSACEFTFATIAITGVGDMTVFFVICEPGFGDNIQFAIGATSSSRCINEGLSPASHQDPCCLAAISSLT